MALSLNNINTGRVWDVEEAYRRIGSSANQGFSTDPFQQAAVQGRGDGYLATRQILQGTLLLQEAPLFTIQDVDDTDDLSHASREQIRGAVAGLSMQNRRAFKALFDCSQGAKTDAGIFQTNNFQLAGNPVRGTFNQGIFLRASRFNHSCAPNAYFHWNQRIGCLTIFAISVIDTNQEILVNYKHENVYQQHSVRRASLVNTYGFNCRCHACRPGQLRNIGENIRSSMRTFYAGLQNNLGNLQAERQFREMLINRLDEVRIPYPQKADTYNDLAQSYLAELTRMGAGNVGNMMHCRAMALKAAQGKLDAELLSIGPNTPEVDASLQLIAWARS
ncbi:MAG: hypothetical protein Q9192_003989 [Flavoplaca navasiana]